VDERSGVCRNLAERVGRRARLWQQGRGRHAQRGRELGQHVELHPLAAILDVADRAALKPNPVPKGFLVQAPVEPGTAHAKAELLVKLVHSRIIADLPREFQSRQR
jgi:hypothetical protein